LAQEAVGTKGASFVLTLWLEQTHRASHEWRWKVHHVQSGDERYLRTLSEVLEFVSERADVSAPFFSQSRTS
jgi:hypothetical protein